MDDASRRSDRMREGVELAHLLEALSSDDEREFFKLLSTGGSIQANQSKLARLLVQRPYPTLQIVQRMREQSKFYIGRALVEALQLLLTECEKSKLQAAAAPVGSDSSGVIPAEISWRFINFLANLPNTVLDAVSLRCKLLKILTGQIVTSATASSSAPHSDHVYVALLSRAEPEMLEELLVELDNNQWQRCDSGSPSAEFVLCQALSTRRRQHFVTLVCTQLQDFRGIRSVAVRNNMLILKLANEFSNVSAAVVSVGADIGKWLDAFAVDESPPDLQEVHAFFYADFQRLAAILAFLRKYPESLKNIPVGTLLNANGMLELLYEYEINASLEESRRIIESIHWQPQTAATKCRRNLELETLTYYGALSAVYDMVLSETNVSLGPYYSTRLLQLNTRLRQVRNIDVLCSLIEDIFQLVFLRWEHVHVRRRDQGSATEPAAQGKTRTPRFDSHTSSTSTDNEDAAAAEQPALPDAHEPWPRHGFICPRHALRTLFTFLKQFVTKKLHSEDYKHASERIQLRFQRIVDIIGEALWKHSVLEKIDESSSLANVGRHCHVLAAEELLQLVLMHRDPRAKSSSDDEVESAANRDRCNYTSLTRRKSAKKRRRATIGGAVVMRGQGRDHVPDNAHHTMTASVDAVSSADHRVLQAALKARHLANSFADQRNFIPSMLGSPENLAIMALALKNFNDVKYIVETFNLQNTELNRELAFVEQQQQVKQKLASIFTNYQQQEEHSQRPTKSEERRATVDQIKSVAAKGFEVSKIISVIDNFAQAQHIQQTAEIKYLLQPHHQQKSDSAGGNNPQLRQFEERNLNAVIICDLILNLPFNREITTNVLMVIKRQHQISPGDPTNSAIFRASAAAGSGGAATASQTTTRNRRELTKEIGAMSLLENLCECMRLTDDRKSLRELLCDSYYSLKPRKLAAELQRERAFVAVFYKTRTEFASCADLKRHATLFQNMLRSGDNTDAAATAKCNYYARFSAYMTHLSKLLQVRDERGVATESECQSTMTRLLKTDACAVIGELIFECQLTPLEIEANVAAMNLNLVHVIALNICPAIAAAGSEGGSNSSSAAARSKISPQKQQTIHNYILNQNRLLAFLLHGISQSQNSTSGTSTFVLAEDKDMNSVFLQRYLQLPEIAQLAALYGGKRFIAALRSDTLNMALVQKLDSKHKQLEILMLQMGNQAPKLRQAKEIDRIIVELIQEAPKNIQLAAHIHDIALRAKLIQDNFTKIATTRLAKELIETTLRHKDASTRIPHTMRAQLEATLADITIYAKVSEVLQFETWPQAYDFGLKTPNAIFERLLQLHLYKLCYKWCCVVNLTQRFAQHKRAFLAALLQTLLELNDAEQVELNLYLLQILRTFALDDCVQFLDANKDRFRSVLFLQYVIEFLAKNDASSPNSQDYKNYRISLVIFEQLTCIEREPFWKLLKFPLLIIEQLIMNTKFEILTKVLNAVRKALQPATPSPLDLQLDNSGVGQLCAFCFDKRGHIYDIHTKSTTSNTQHKVRFQLGANDCSPNHANSAFILLNFNLYQNDHHITHDCIDLLLRIYATKALDYHISDASSVASSSAEHFSQTTDIQQSLDSLCGAFEMPRVPPRRDDWVRDEEATHCMCCRRAAFTMLMRRHHCRRCGRVVCFACSSQRMRIPELYADVEVRICNDCSRHNEELAAATLQRQSAESGVDNVAGARTESSRSGRRLRENDIFKWKLSGNITHDKLVREEFCYEHAPSVALCLSILDYHLGQQKCIDLLLYHCRKLEKLIVPNPEVDYELVAKMMNCLALAAKVRGGPADVENIREHSEIIMAVVQNGCDTLIPPGPLSNHSLRKLADSLIQAEKWQLALEVHLKCGFPNTGVMAAHGLACLRAGCFDTAREKFSHCMPKLSNEITNSQIYKCINSSTATDSNDNPTQTSDMPPSQLKRPQRGPPLLQEILRIVESFPPAKPQPETLHRASIIRNSNTSLASLLSRRKDPFAVPMSEPALNVLTTLANLKRIAKGHYAAAEPSSIDRLLLDNRQQQQQLLRQSTTKTTRGFEECMHYVLTYGSHADILQFLMRHQELPAALRYFSAQCSDADLFIQHIYLVALRCGQVPPLIAQVLECDAGATDSLPTWRQTLLQTCRYLETQNLMSSLYQLQVLLKDPVRASMTCVKFYSMNCSDFQQLHANAEHLRNAHMHLQSELELAQWENIQVETSLSSSTKSSTTSARNRKVSKQSIRRSSSTSSAAGIFLMQMDARSLNSHINTILKQLDVAKFLANCEREHMLADGQTTLKILKQIRNESVKSTLPTLFDTAQDKIQICILILLCGKNIEEGFGLTYRIIQDYKLPPMKVYAATAKFLARNNRVPEVEKLLNCVTSNNGTNSRDIDEILSIAINSAVNSHDTEVKIALDTLAKRIHSIELRISCHIFIGQLKSAYLLANKHERLADIRKILRQAELTNQIHIRKLCEKKLQMHTSLTSASSAARVPL